MCDQAVGNSIQPERCPLLIVHGGAWAIPESLTQASKAGVVKAVQQGHRVLRQGQSAVDAVEVAIKVMEDDPAFDAGTGSVLNANGEVEMDAIIMDGRTLQLGAIACVQDIKNPISLARMVMEKTDHTMLVGQGANQFAEEMGVVRVPSESLVTQEAKEEFERFLKFQTAVQVSFRAREAITLSGCDTVGAVAMDCHGNIAFGTSTGGITAKRPGRVGDSPLVGCGGYADNTIGGVSTTGHGESITRVMLAANCLQHVKQGFTAQDAAERSLSYMSERVRGCGGLVMLTSAGEVGIHFTTERMAWACCQGKSIVYGIDHGDNFVEDLMMDETS